MSTKVTISLILPNALPPSKMQEIKIRRMLSGGVARVDSQLAALVHKHLPNASILVESCKDEEEDE